VADLSLDKEMLKAVIEKNDGARRAAGEVRGCGHYVVSQRRSASCWA